MVFAATAVAPFGADTVPAVLHRVLHAEPDLAALPPRLRGMVAAALAKDPGGRPSARTLMMSLVDPRSGPVPGSAVPPPAGGARYLPDGGATDRGRASLTTQGGARRGRRGLLLAAAAVTVAALAGGTVVLVNLPSLRTGDAGGSSPTASLPSTGPSPGPASSTDPASSTGRTAPADPGSSSPASESAKGLKIPAAFAGSWSGHTDSTNPMDPDGADNTVELRAGASTAAWSEKDAQVDCEADIELTKVQKTKLTFRLAQAGGCIPGTIELTLGDGVLRYLWRDVPGLGVVQQTGDLRRG